MAVIEAFQSLFRGECVLLWCLMLEDQTKSSETPKFCEKLSNVYSWLCYNGTTITAYIHACTKVYEAQQGLTPHKHLDRPCAPTTHKQVRTPGHITIPNPVPDSGH